ncbi:MAG: hypothetical protein WA021_01455 [Minisyncoccia bacterium]
MATVKTNPLQQCHTLAPTNKRGQTIVEKRKQLREVAGERRRDHAATQRVSSRAHRATTTTTLASGRSNPSQLLDWARYQAKSDASDYIQEALEFSKMKKKDLAKALGIHPTRLSQLISMKGELAYEPVPSALLYEIAHITKCPYEARCTKLSPPPLQPEAEERTNH